MTEDRGSIRRIKKLNSTLFSAIEAAKIMDQTTVVPLDFLMQQSKAARARVQELEAKLEAELEKQKNDTKLENGECKVKKETADVKVKMEKGDDN